MYRTMAIEITLPLEGKFLNQFHKESTERSLRYLEERKKQPLDLEKELRVQKEIHLLTAENKAYLDRQFTQFGGC